MVGAVGLDLGLNRVRDRPVGAPNFVLVDHRRSFAVVAHARHQVTQSGLAFSRQVVSGVAENMNVEGEDQDTD
jgi:hypothetical protein